MRLFPTPPYRDVPELLDNIGEANDAELQHTLRDIRRANIFGLGTWVVLRHLAALLKDHPRDVPVTVLDLATGSADIPEEICRWAERRGYDVRVVATDISPEILGVARQRIERAGYADRVSFLTCDATQPPFKIAEFDIVTCSLALHHLSLEQARAALPHMKRLARLGFIVNDVYRSQGAWYMAWFLTRVATTNRLTRHDGPASVYRAFTPAEVRRLAREADIELSVSTYPFWRMAACGPGLERGERA